jgi:hypothetical protein
MKRVAIVSHIENPGTLDHELSAIKHLDPLDLRLGRLGQHAESKLFPAGPVCDSALVKQLNRRPDDDKLLEHDYVLRFQQQRLQRHKDKHPNVRDARNARRHDAANIATPPCVARIALRTSIVRDDERIEYAHKHDNVQRARRRAKALIDNGG